MSALEAAQALGAPIPLRKPSGNSSHGNGHAFNHQEDDQVEDDLVVDDNDLEPSLPATSTEPTSAESSGRIKLLFGPNKVSISAPPTRREEALPKEDTYSDASSDDAMMIDIDEGIDDLARPSSGGGKRRPSDHTPSNTSSTVKRVKVEVDNDMSDDAQSNLDQPNDVFDSSAGKMEQVDLDGADPTDSQALRHPRKAKSRGKGFTTKRRPSDGKGVWKPRKKSLHTILSKLIAAFKQKDHYGFFLEPVDTSIVTDYMTVITEPMDLGTMDKKVKRRVYKSCAEFKRDFLLVTANAKTYNSPDTVYYKSAEKLEAYGNRYIAREEPNIETEQDRAESRSGKTVAMNGVSDLRRIDGKKKPKRIKQTEELDSRLKRQFMPDGTIRKDSSWHEPMVSSYEQHLGRFSFHRHHSWTRTDPSTIPHGIHDYGPYHYRESPTASLNPILLRNAFGDAEGQAYVRSLERFTEGLPPIVKARSEKTMNHVTRGAYAVIQKTRETLVAEKGPGKKQAGPVIVPTDWGAVDVAKQIHHLATEVDRIIKAAEIEMYRREGVDIVPLLCPASLGAQDKDLAEELETNNMLLLLEKNCRDLEEWSGKQMSRLTGKSQHPYEEESSLAERVRRRLLQLVQKAPPSEFENATGLPSLETIRSMYQIVGTSGSPRPPPMVSIPSTPLTSGSNPTLINTSHAQPYLPSGNPIRAPSNQPTTPG
ncbi:hypothetical protein DFJ77DRAFT_313250 [Powellomyces hirtus]|nr:hypothetical protein DFJ77DRAFT_313250 [Powellomyces hirtus]